MGLVRKNQRRGKTAPGAGQRQLRATVCRDYARQHGGRNGGYEDHGWWRKLNIGGVCFVSRLKDSTSYVIVETRPIVPGTNILRDEVVILASDKASTAPLRLRRIEIWLEDKQDTMVFVTHHLKLAASTIAAIYRDRWQIELFFKAIKQSLRIKTFIGTSENAVQTQIWTALIAMLRQQLFVYGDLWVWLNQPFQPPVALDDPQMSLPITG